MLESGCGAGCFDLRAAIVDSFASVTESSEQAKRTAPLKSPSSNFSETLVAKDSKGSNCQFLCGKLTPRGRRWEVTLLS